MNKVYFNDDDDDDGDQVSTKKKKSEMGICLPVSALNSFGYMVCYKRYCVWTMWAWSIQAHSWISHLKLIIPLRQSHPPFLLLHLYDFTYIFSLSLFLSFTFARFMCFTHCAMCVRAPDSFWFKHKHTHTHAHICRPVIISIVINITVYCSRHNHIRIKLRNVIMSIQEKWCAFMKNRADRT